MKVLLWIGGVIAAVFVLDALFSKDQNPPVVIAGPVIDGNAHPGEPVEMLFRDSANANGRSCAVVTQVKALGQTETGVAIIAAACSGGERYAFSMTADHKISFISSCSSLEAVSGKSCF